MSLATATPAEIDGDLARIYSEQARYHASIEQAVRDIERIDSVQGTYQADFRWNSPAKRDDAVATKVHAEQALNRLNTEATAREEEFRARGGWTRYYLVTNGNGHVHSSTGCATCFPTTRYAWLTEQSGMTAEALVDLAGEKACTVCFPWAPVDALRQKSRLEAPERKAAREERERKAAEKHAAEVTVEGYVDYKRVGTKVFKTVRAVTNDIASNLGSLAWYGMEHPSANEWLGNVDVCRNALAERGEAYDYDKALAAARKKVVREGGKPKF